MCKIKSRRLAGSSSSSYARITQSHMLRDIKMRLARIMSPNHIELGLPSASAGLAPDCVSVDLEL